MNNQNKPILITGSHRSGTTWAGKIIATSPKVAYIFEPFNVTQNPSVSSIQFEYWYQYITRENDKGVKEALDWLLQFKYPLINNLHKANDLRSLVKIARDQSLFLGYAHNGYRPLLKDPIAIFSAAWLAETYGMQVLVMIRHPAAFCSSLKIKDWHFDFSNFLNQPMLIERYLHPYRAEIEYFSRHKMSVIEQGILLWNCIHHTISIYQTEQKGWIFRKHEELSVDPLSEYKKIFDLLELDFTSTVIKKIEDASGDKNPIEQDPKNNFIRNSKLNIKNWLTRLTPSEISLIREKTISVSSLFYAEKDWHHN